MKSIKENSKTLLLIVGGVISVIICCFIWIQTTANTAIGYEEKSIKKLLLIGAGRISYYLLNILKNNRIKVKLIEQKNGPCTNL